MVRYISRQCCVSEHVFTVVVCGMMALHRRPHLHHGSLPEGQLLHGKPCQRVRLTPYLGEPGLKGYD